MRIPKPRKFDINPEEWHYRPKGYAGKPCPICQCPDLNVRAMHRVFIGSPNTYKKLINVKGSYTRRTLHKDGSWF